MLADKAFQTDVNQLLDETNKALLTRLEASNTLDGSQFDRWMNDEIDLRLTKLAEICNTALPDNNILRGAVAKAWRNVSTDVRAEAAFQNRPSRAPTAPSQTASAAERDLIERNIHVARLSDDSLKAINQGLKEHQQFLEAQDYLERGKRYWRPLPLAGAWWDALQDALKRNDFLAATSAYFGVPMAVGSVNLVYSSESESWWKGCYANEGLADSPACYFHHDQDFAQIKSVIYLSDTAMDQGPFSYINNGTKFRTANILPHFYFHMGSSMAATAKALNHRASSYFRPYFQNSDIRAAYAALPPRLLGSTHFGDDLMPGAEATDAFLHQERYVTSDQGNAVLFNGGDIFHRGGLVRRGNRWTLQIMFEQQKPLGQRIKNRAKAMIRHHTGNLLGLRRYESLKLN